MATEHLAAAEVASSISEKTFMGQVVDLAEKCRWRWYHTYDSRRSPHGFLDLTMVRPPRLIFAELKVKGGRTTVHQLMWMNDLRGVPSVEVYLWTPLDWDQIEDVLRYRPRRKR